MISKTQVAGSMRDARASRRSAASAARAAFVAARWRLKPAAVVAAALWLGAGLPARAADPAAPAVAVSADSYKIHGGDQLNVIVFGEKDLSRLVTVLPNGTVGYPLIGEVRVAGLTPAQAAQTIAASLKHFLRQPQVSVAVSQEGPLEVLVIGNVKTPGKYELPSRSRITDALASAGGLGPTDGAYPSARLADAQGDVQRVSLEKLLHDGDTTQNLPLADEMTVYVPSPLTLQVQVLGAVDKPGDVVVHEGDRLSMAVARAGDSQNTHADLNHITVRRLGPNGSTQTLNVNLYDALKSGDISRDPVLQKNDLVYVPEAGGHGSQSSGFLSVLYLLSSF